MQTDVTVMLCVVLGHRCIPQVRLTALQGERCPHFSLHSLSIFLSLHFIGFFDEEKERGEQFSVPSSSGQIEGEEHLGKRYIKRHIYCCLAAYAQIFSKWNILANHKSVK